MDEDMKKAYEQRHRQACLLCYELLGKVWPPDRTVEYWERTARIFAANYDEHRDNPLTRHLLTGIYFYLGDAAGGVGSDASHKGAFRVVLDLADSVVQDMDHAAEIIDLARGEHRDNALCQRMLTALGEYVKEERVCKH